jgi:hypothetical protein
VVSDVGAACTLPFDSIKEHHPIDDSCSADGNAKPDTPQSAQNDAKNNFCSNGTPVDISVAVLRQLQANVSKPGGGVTFGSDGQLPKDRTVLRDLPTDAGSLSEGMVVRLAAFVMDAHASNLGKGESVNCNQPDAASNDIHIVLADSSGETDECNSVTAEMSPHFRPELWTPANLKDKKSQMYRFTGQLFFDASHRPCSGGKGSPKRSSLWEIHPVYGLDICPEGKTCKVDSDDNWVSFTNEISPDEGETRLLVPDEISTQFGATQHRRTRLP